jgi:hypothetical protein
MLARPLLSRILRNESMTRGLGDPEARVLVEWLVDRAEALADTAVGPVEPRLETLCRRGRAIGRFVLLWCYYQQRGAALQLAAAERFGWPFPEAAVDPCELMQAILGWENRRGDL